MSSPPPTTLANARSCCPNTRIVCSRSAPLRQVIGGGDAAVCTVAYINRMNTRSTLLAALVFLALAPAALADKIPLADLSAYLNGLTTADTQFTQVNADGSVATGKLFLQRPGRARFEYAPPDKSLVLASGGQVAIFDAKSNQPPEQYPLARTPLNLILANSTSILIAHRLSTLRRADRLVVLERGEVVELGSHEELMAERGAYWRLYEAQARNVDTEDLEPPRVHIPLARVVS